MSSNICICKSKLTKIDRIRITEVSYANKWTCDKLIQVKFICISNYYRGVQERVKEKCSSYRGSTLLMYLWAKRFLRGHRWNAPYIKGFTKLLLMPKKKIISLNSLLGWKYQRLFNLVSIRVCWGVTMSPFSTDVIIILIDRGTPTIVYCYSIWRYITAHVLFI